MTVDVLEGRQLKITLSATEICDYFGSFSEIRYDNDKAKSAMGSLYRKATEKTDFSLCGKKLFIEVFPTDLGGCTILFTVKNGKRLHIAGECTAFHFSSCENMLCACEALENNGFGECIADLYTQKDAYRLIIKLSAAKDLCAEFADEVYHGKTEIEKTREYWRTVAVSTPVKIFCGL